MAILTVGFVPDAYAPRYVTGVQQGEKLPHSARVYLVDASGRGHWAVPIATLYTSGESDDDGKGQ